MWGNMNPNSQHQLWSEWTFNVWDSGKHPSYNEVLDNTRRWLRKGFGSVGEMKVEEKVRSWHIVVRVEGVPATDPNYQVQVHESFQRFVEQGWGILAVGVVDVKILAGDEEKGEPPAQLVVLPIINLETS